MSVEKQILSLIQSVNPESPADYVLNIVRPLIQEKLKKDILNCTECTICNVAKSIVMGNLSNTKILVISEYITQQQLENCGTETVLFPFEHSHNEEIVKDMVDIFDQDVLAFSDILHCYPYRRNYTQRVPSLEEITKCVGFTYELISAVRPIYIVLVGNIALNALVSDKMIADKDHGKWVTVAGYPAFILQRPDVNSSYFLQDLDTFVTRVRKEHPTLLRRND